MINIKIKINKLINYLIVMSKLLGNMSNIKKFCHQKDLRDPKF